MQKLEWEGKAQEIFDKLLSKLPESFHPVVKPTTIEAAEKRCIQRQAAYVNLADLIAGIFDVVPEAFKSTVVGDLKSFGVDVEKYVEIKQYRDRLMTSWSEVAKGFQPGVMHIAMYLTDECNMKCLHCATDRAPRPELSIEQWCKITDNIEAGLATQGRHATFVWFGGEPTMRKDIDKLMKHCKDRGYYHAMITNGVKFDDAFAKMVKSNGMSHVFVSFDSADPKKNDKLRGFPNSLHYAEQAIKNCINNGIFVCASITAMKQNINELAELKALAEKWGAEPYFRAVLKQNRAAQYWDEIGLSKEDYKKLYDFKFNRAIKALRAGEGGNLANFEIYEMTPFMEFPQDDKEMCAIEWGIGCLACRSMLGIEVDGTIYPCGYPTKTTLGNALTDKFEDVLNTQLFKDIRDRKRKGKCGGCHHLKYCGGGCAIHTEAETGDILGSFPYCWHENDHRHIDGKIVKFK